jgi:glycosyltransferase involved in cell wall biosynthesis
LDARGFSSVLMTGVVSRGESDMTPVALKRGVQSVVIPELQRDPRLLDDIRAFVKICRTVFALRPDVIHTHTAKAGGLGRLAALLYNAYARVMGRPRAVVCHTLHGHLFVGYFPRWASTLLIVGERMLARVTDRVITVSEQLKHELTGVYRICPETKCTVVPLGVDFGWTRDLPALRGALRREVGVPSDCLAAGLVGRLTAIKNHELFFRAALACRVPSARFLVVGDGDRRAALKDLVQQLGLDGRVVFTGWQHDPAKVYAGLDVCCLTSLNEGTPVALIEAMAAGIPIVATNIGGVADLMIGAGTLDPRGFAVFANGILVPTGRADIFGAALEFLASRPDLRRTMGAAGGAFVRERFSVDRLVSQMERLYLDLLAGERS